MLFKDNRLRKKNDFDLVFKKGKWAKEDFLLLKFLPNKLKKSRFGFIVGKKFSNKAADRNKTKRRLRELARASLPGIKGGFDAVLLVKPGLEKESFANLKNSFNLLLKKAGLLK